MAVGFGISLGYHRLHTHRGFKTSKAFEYFLAVCGTLTLEGGPIFWVATHRVASPALGPRRRSALAARRRVLGAHGLDPVRRRASQQHRADGASTRPISAADPFYRWLNTYHCVPLDDPRPHPARHRRLADGVLGHLPARVFGLHATWLVNSATHMWGSRRFETRDDSRNSWWVALLTFGEGWHNNHHAHPVSARHGLAWYEFDISWITLKLFNAIGIVGPEGRKVDLEGCREGRGSRVSRRSVRSHRRTARRERRSAELASSELLLYPSMISGRRRSVIFFTVLGICLVALAVTLNVSWLVLNWRRGVLAILGVIFFLLIIAGHGAEHHLPGARDPAERAARLVHQRRHPRAEDAGGVDPALPADAAGARAGRGPSGASSTASCSRTATGCCTPSIRCCGPAAPDRAARRSAASRVDLGRDRPRVRRAGADPVHLEPRRWPTTQTRRRPARSCSAMPTS